MNDATNNFSTPEGAGSSGPSRPEGGTPPARTKLNPQLLKAQRAYVSTQHLASASRTNAPRTAPLPPPVAAPSESNGSPQEVPKILQSAVNPIADVQKQIEQVQRNVYGTLNTLLLQPLRRLLTLVLGPINRLVEIVNQIMARIVELSNRTLKLIFRVGALFHKGPLPDIEELRASVPTEEKRKTPAQDAPPPPPPAKVTWSDMLELNIIFMNNQETPLYSLKQTRGTGRLGKLEEQMVCEAAITAIQECAVFAEEFPPPASGPYAGHPVKDIMEKVTMEDVQGFLRFVKAYPGKYVGRPWKISETFATWLLNNSPGP